MKNIQKIVNILAFIIVAWQALNFIQPPTAANASSPYGQAVCFYPKSAVRIEAGKYRFFTDNPTEKMYLVTTSAAIGGIITFDDGGPDNADLNKLFPRMLGRRN